MRARFLLPRTTVSPPEPVGGAVPAIIAASGVIFVGLLAWSRLNGHSLSPATWYLTRAAGLTLYVLLWATVALGLGMTTQTITRLGMGKSVVYSLHGYLTGISYGFLGLHLISLAADPFAHYSLAQLLIPFRNPWREPWTGFGVIAAYLTVALGGSFALRRFTGYRAWRAMHWLTFALYLTALAHGLGSGTDASTWWARLMYAATTGSVVWLIAARVRHGSRRNTPLLAPTTAPYDRFGRTPGQPRRQAATAPASTTPVTPTPAMRKPVPVREPAPMRQPAPARPAAPRRPVSGPLPNAALYLNGVDGRADHLEYDDDLAFWRAKPLVATEPHRAPAGSRRAVRFDVDNIR